MENQRSPSLKSSKSNSRPDSPVTPSEEQQQETSLVDNVIHLPLKILGYVWSMFSPPPLSALNDSFESEASEDRQEELYKLRRDGSGLEDSYKVQSVGLKDFPVIYDEEGNVIPSLNREQIKAIIEDGSPVTLVGREEQPPEDCVLTDTMASTVTKI